MSRLRYALIILSLLTPSPCLAVNFYDGVRTKGLYFLTYSSAYYADTVSGVNGDTAVRDYRYSRFEELARVCWYKDDYVLTAMFPVGYARRGSANASSGGLGDVSLGAGHFLPWRGADVLPMVFVKFPTGEYDAGKAVNYGSNQYDIRPVIFIYKQTGRLSFDGAAKYFHRMKNPATGILPGNEFHLQGLLGWQFSNWFKAGPSVTWYRGADQEKGGSRRPGTRRECLSAGADFYFKLPLLSVTLTWLHDVSSKNATRGDFVQVKTCSKF